MTETITLPRSVVERALEHLTCAVDEPVREALRKALEQPQVDQEPDAFYEWWYMRPSLTRLQAWLLWKDEQKQLKRAHGIGGEV